MPASIINTELYPVDDLDSTATADWIQDIRADLERDGSSLLPDFVSPQTLTQMLHQVQRITHLAYPGPTEVSPYFFNYQLGEAEDLPDRHPLKRRGRRNLAQVAADLIPEDFLLNQLYRSASMHRFLAAVTGHPIHRNRDPYQSLNISVMDEGGCQQWHFDSGDMVTTLLLQQPEAGGVFEYAPAIRSDDNENFDAVQQVLDGNRDRVRQNHLAAGTLSLFRGHYSLHRVTPVEGKRQRIQAILGYSAKPNLYGNKASSILHYGPRVAEIEATSPRYPE